jgi:hypothetical protein
MVKLKKHLLTLVFVQTFPEKAAQQAPKVYHKMEFCTKTHFSDTVECGFQTCSLWYIPGTPCGHSVPKVVNLFQPNKC